MDKKTAFIQDNILYLLIPIILLGAGGYYSYEKITLMSENRKTRKRRARKGRKENYQKRKSHL